MLILSIGYASGLPTLYWPHTLSDGLTFFFEENIIGFLVLRPGIRCDSKKEYTANPPLPPLGPITTSGILPNLLIYICEPE